jgi:D-sedoheptulose 7-phosphate isomerase
MEAQAALESLLANERTLRDIDHAAGALSSSLRAGGKVMSCGNGGSMCDAIHFAEELSGRYRHNRKALGAIPMSDPAHMTCVANDFGYEFVFSRFVEAHGKQGDCLLAISTSGASPSILNAALSAKDQGVTVIGLSGKQESSLNQLADICICTPVGRFSDRVQELHIKVLHILVELVELKLELA